MTRVCLGKHRRHKWRTDQETYVKDGAGGMVRAAQHRFCWRMCGARQSRAFVDGRKGPWVDVTAEDDDLAESLLYQGSVLHIRGVRRWRGGSS